MKSHGTQRCLLAMLEKWKRFVESGKAFGTLLTDLPEGFDCLDHDVLITNLNVYRYNLPALRLIHDYPPHRKQGTRFINLYSEWFAVMFGVAQGSILEPLLVKNFLAGLMILTNRVILTLQITIRSTFQLQM